MFNRKFMIEKISLVRWIMNLKTAEELFFFKWSRVTISENMHEKLQKLCKFVRIFWESDAGILWKNFFFRLSASFNIVIT